MNFKSVFSKIATTTSNPSRMRLKQYLLMGSILGAGLLAYVVVRGASTPKAEIKPTAQKEPVTRTPLEAVSSQDVWNNRIQREAESAKSEVGAVRDLTQLLVKRMEMMEKALQGLGTRESKTPEAQDPSILSEESSLESDLPLRSGTAFKPPDAPSSQDDKLFEADRPSSKFLHLSLKNEDRPLLKNVDNYVPAGSYARAILTSGVVASTALQESSHPQPIVMRLIDDGRLPRGFRGAMNQNVLIGSCHGDLSSERVRCRLVTMAWVEENGTTVEKKVEGWIIGEDGRPGLRGRVVDRSGDAVRDTMIAGMLSGLSGFFKAESMSSVYPISPFGQTNALGAKQALAGAAGSGASSALDKLAEYSIKRAEKMSPVLEIESGRKVDVVFETGVDIRPEVVAPSLTLIDQKQQPTNKGSSDESY